MFIPTELKNLIAKFGSAETVHRNYMMQVCKQIIKLNCLKIAYNYDTNRGIPPRSIKHWNMHRKCFKQFGFE